MRLYLAAVILAMLMDMAHAQPQKLSDEELGDVAAGLLDVYVIMPVIIVNNNNNSTNTAVNSPHSTSTAISDIKIDNVISISPTDTLISAAPITVNSSPSVTAPLVQMPTIVQGPNAPPVWVPWAAELRGTLGVR